MATNGTGTGLPGRATRIVATIGPRAEARGALEELLRAGADVVRLNAAHCRPGDIARRVARVRAAERRVGRPVGVLLDLGGPKIRVAHVRDGSTEWKVGDIVTIAPGSAPGEGHRISVTYPALLRDLGPGDEIRIDDGKLRLSVVAKAEGALEARVLVGGRARAGAGVNFPSAALSAPALTAKDRRDLREGLAAGVDLVGLSFVRSAAHVLALERLLAPLPEGTRPWVVAKVERIEAVRDLAAVARAADVLMVARGDLGVEIGLPSVPRVQRRILSLGRRLGVPVIVATQMLESMIESPTPTRAEVSDVAGAVHDGADAVMLSGETAVGRFPLEAVAAMAEIARTAEVPDPGEPAPDLFEPSPEDFAAVLAGMACRAAILADARAIVVFTRTGRTAKLVSKAAGPIPVLAFTPHQEVRRRLTVLRNVTSFRIADARSVEQMLRHGDAVLSRLPGFPGQTIVRLAGTALVAGATNTVQVRRLPEARPTRRRAAGSRAQGSS
ncbi:MAG: pyruvate kinase [Acidobacteria bacterium]|nr:MAG: pyruvate kinase [Acidobacteriota bacterium]